MPKPPEARGGGKGPPTPLHNDPRRASLELVQDLAEPLTAIANYLEAAARLHEADTRSARTKLGEVFEKSQRQVARANEVLRQLRDLLRGKSGAAGG